MKIPSEKNGKTKDAKIRPIYCKDIPSSLPVNLSVMMHFIKMWLSWDLKGMTVPESFKSDNMDLICNCRKRFTRQQTAHCSACSKPVLCFYKSWHSRGPVQVGGVWCPPENTAKRDFVVVHHAQITWIKANNHTATGIKQRRDRNTAVNLES